MAIHHVMGLMPVCADTGIKFWFYNYGKPVLKEHPISPILKRSKLWYPKYAHQHVPNSDLAAKHVERNQANSYADVICCQLGMTNTQRSMLLERLALSGCIAK